MIFKPEDDFDLARIDASGQCFRWRRMEDGEWLIPHCGQILRIRKKGDVYDLDCDLSSFDSLWRDYFDLDENYRAIRIRIDPADPSLTRAAEAGKGIRILRQDPWEALVSFIISQNKNIPAIRRCVERLTEAAGEKREGVYAFPTAESVLAMGEEGLKACSLGYRARFVFNAAEEAAAGKLDLNSLLDDPEERCMDRLMALTGVGMKVAGCVCLFGLHKMNAFPVDVWMKRVLETHYPDGFPFERYAPYCGVYQQYLFAWIREQ